MGAAPELNVSTTNIQEPVAMSGGDQPLSFDDIEAVSNFKKVEKEHKAKEEKETKSAPKSKEREGDDDGKEENKKNQEKVTQSKDDDKEQAKIKQEKDIKSELAKAKSIKVKKGEEDIDLPSNTLIPVKIDGKVEEIELQKVLDGYSGQAHLSRLYSQYKKEKEDYEKDKTSIQQGLNKLSEMVQGGDPRGAVEYLAEAMGADGYQVWQEFVKKIDDLLEGQRPLSQEQKEALRLKEENEYWKRKHESHKEKLSAREEEETLRTKISSLQEKHGISNQDFAMCYDDLVSSGKFTEDDVTPELVVEYYTTLKTQDYVAKSINEVNPALDKGEFQEAVREISSHALKMGMSESEIKAAVMALYETEGHKRLARKIKKSEDKARGELGVRNPSSDPLYFSDLDE